MSDEPEGKGWWLASDGKWYPPWHPPRSSTRSASSASTLPVVAAATASFAFLLGSSGGFSCDEDCSSGTVATLYVLIGYAYAAALLGAIVLLRSDPEPSGGCGPRVVAGIVDAGLVILISMMWFLANIASGEAAVWPANVSLAASLIIGVTAGALWPLPPSAPNHH